MMTESSPIWKGIKTPTSVLLTHGDSIATLSPDYTVIARSSDHSDIIVGIAHQSLPLFGLQFHRITSSSSIISLSDHSLSAEVNLTDHGTIMLKNFLVDVCGCRQTYTPV